MTAFSRARRCAARRRPAGKTSRRPEGRSSRAVAGKPHRDRVLGYWLLPLPTIDPIIVVAQRRRAAVRTARTFRYSHYAGTKTLRYAAGGAAGAGAMLAWPPRCRRCATP